MGMIEGSGGSIPPDIKATYKQEFARSVDLFQKSLQEYEKTEEFHKKAKFKDVMDKALQIMNETAKACLSKKAQSEKTQLEKDYQNFIQHDNPETYDKLNEDIDHLKDYL
ncbi:MAG TPA: hypothetical protein VLG49_06420 [Rhabdochlamydiaceae bacterium]|nr:hypothetical protein [Rhabdochlamydiaceae bacterium]